MCVRVWKRRGRAENILLFYSWARNVFWNHRFTLTKCLWYFNTVTRRRLTSDVALLMSSTLPSVSIIIMLACVPGRQVSNEILKLWVGVAHVGGGRGGGGWRDLTDTVVRELSQGTNTGRDRNACHNIKLEKYLLQNLYYAHQGAYLFQAHLRGGLQRWVAYLM